MEHSDFIQAKQFIYSDIEREIKLAHATENEENKEILNKLGVSGGGNFLAALGLLSYTEFAGKLKYNEKKNGYDFASKNFNKFFDDLGPYYKQIRNSGVNIYSIFRCGLVHEYSVKKNCTIYMCGDKGSPGIGVDENGKYYFVVEAYFKAFKVAFELLESDLYPTS